MAASKLILLNQPNNTRQGCRINGGLIPGYNQATTGIIVGVADSNGNIVTTDTSTATVAIGTNPSGGTLSGTTSVAAVNGVAVFDNLFIDKSGTGYTLTFSDGALTTVTTAAFNEVAVNRVSPAEVRGTLTDNSVSKGVLYRYRGGSTIRNLHLTAISTNTTDEIQISITAPGADITNANNEYKLATQTCPYSDTIETGEVGGNFDLYVYGSAVTGTVTVSISRINSSARV